MPRVSHSNQAAAGPGISREFALPLGIAPASNEGQVKEIVDIFVKQTELIPPGETSEELQKARDEESGYVERDRSSKNKKTGGLFRGFFDPRRFKRLTSSHIRDGVYCCSVCGWEIDDDGCQCIDEGDGDSSADDLSVYDYDDDGTDFSGEEDPDEDDHLEASLLENIITPADDGYTPSVWNDEGRDGPSRRRYRSGEQSGVGPLRRRSGGDSHQTAPTFEDSERDINDDESYNEDEEEDDGDEDEESTSMRDFIDDDESEEEAPRTPPWASPRRHNHSGWPQSGLISLEADSAGSDDDGEYAEGDSPSEGLTRSGLTTPSSEAARGTNGRKRVHGSVTPTADGLSTELPSRIQTRDGSRARGTSRGLRRRRVIEDSSDDSDEGSDAGADQLLDTVPMDFDGDIEMGGSPQNQPQHQGTSRLAGHTGDSRSAAIQLDEESSSDGSLRFLSRRRRHGAGQPSSSVRPATIEVQVPGLLRRREQGSANGGNSHPSRPSPRLPPRQRNSRNRRRNQTSRRSQPARDNASTLATAGRSSSSRSEVIRFGSELSSDEDEAPRRRRRRNGIERTPMIML